MARNTALIIAFLAIGAVAMETLPLPSGAADSKTETPRAGRVEGQEAPVDNGGALRVPSDYATTYEFLGSWAIAADNAAGSQQIHNVYASPGTIEAYLKTGQFPDATVLVKEVREAKTNSMTTGTVSHAETLKGWFVMMRDGKNAHPGDALWGDGWGWSWFDANAPLKTTSTDYKTECQPCHIPAESTEWVYTWGYAPLKR